MSRPGDSIDKLPDDVLLDMFDFFVEGLEITKTDMEKWQTLVHVCRRWRSLVFRSPRRLNLVLFCSDRTPARDTLDAWPAYPLFIQCHKIAESVDNIIAVLERSDRVLYIDFTRIKRPNLKRILAAMQVPFPELIDLRLSSDDKTVSVLPDSFLGGSAPRLGFLWLEGIPFPGLPKLLLSATHLVDLRLHNIPHLGYFSPESMVTGLSTLTRLELLWLIFQSPQSRPDQARQRPPPPIRSVLPALTHFLFQGVSEYLEIVVARIDAPRLNKLHIAFLNQMVFDTTQFAQFTSRTPMLKPLEKARVTFEDDVAVVNLSSQISGKDEVLEVRTSCWELDQQILSVEHVFTSCLPPLPTLEDLHIYENLLWRAFEDWQDSDNVENALWLELLHPFTSVKNLYLSEYISRRIVPALQELVGDRATEVLPILQNILLEERQPSGPVQEGIQQIVAARQATWHPITVSYGQEVRFDH